MAATLIQEYITTDGSILHRADKIYDSYQDAAYSMIDYYDAFYLRPNMKLLPADLQVLYTDAGFTWDEFTLAQQIIQDRYLYYANKTFGIDTLDFIAGPGLHLYLLDEIPTGFRFLFSSDILGGKRSNRKKGSANDKKLSFGDQKIVGYRVGEMFSGGFLSDEDSSTDESDSSDSGVEEDIEERRDLVSDTDSGDEEQDLGALAAGLGISGRGFKFPASVAGSGRSDFNVQRFVDGNDDESAKYDTEMSGGQLSPPPDWDDIQEKYCF